MPQLAVLVSGTGSILQAIVDADLPIAVVVADRPCAAEDIGARAGRPVIRVARTEWGSSFDREAYTERLVRALGPHSVDVVAMAGFGTVLGGAIHAAYPGRILNTHPALLPSFKGWHAVSEALAAGVEETGCTVHLATRDVDDGPILAQEAVKVLPEDTVESLHERIKEVERRLYPETLRTFLSRLSREEAVS